MKKIIFACATALALCSVAPDTEPPRVVRTIPANGDRAVDPSLTTLTVTFNEPMQDGSWSWAYTTLDSFPKMTGAPKYIDPYTSVLPVKLEPDKEYEVWINSSKFKNFKDKAGNPAEPYVLRFKTR